MAFGTTAALLGGGALLAGGGGLLANEAAGKQSAAGQEAAMRQAEAQLQAIKQNEIARLRSQSMLAPYMGYGLMGMERMMGTQPMTQTMGGNAQQLMRQQSPTLTERTNLHLGAPFTNEMLGNMLGETGQVSPTDWLTGKRGKLKDEDAKTMLRRQAHNMLMGRDKNYQQPGRPWMGYEYGPETPISSDTSIPTAQNRETRDLSSISKILAMLTEKRALGGPVRSSQPYLVGENGPEIMVPQKAGTVIPNMTGNMLAGAQRSIAGGNMLSTNPVQKPLSMQEQLRNKAKNMLNARTGGGKTNYNMQPQAPTQYPAPTGYMSNLMNNMPSNPLDSPLYTLDPAIQSLMDWENMSNQPPTAPQKGILEQGPPDPGKAPTRTPFDFQAYQESPWYQQPLQQGIDAIQRSAIGQGNLYSGGTMEALNKFGQDYAFSKYMPAREQELTESNSDFSRWLQGGQFGLQNWLQGTLQPTQEMIRIGQGTALNNAQQNLMNSELTGQYLSNIGAIGGSSALNSGSAYAGLYNNYGNALSGLGGNLLNQGLGRLI